MPRPPLLAPILVVALATAAGSVTPVAARDGYYYPPVGSDEAFARTLGGSENRVGRGTRVGFVTQITKSQLEAPEAPRFAIFAKGAEAEHMIIVALDDDVFRTLFRARAVLAQLSSQARVTDFFVNNGIETTATWFDLAKILGFEDIVISDGLSWSHRVNLRP
ncbi:MAG: hypothetical protein ACFBRM_11135 [Pikeienuella sp.]